MRDAAAARLPEPRRQTSAGGPPATGMLGPGRDRRRRRPQADGRPPAVRRRLRRRHAVHGDDERRAGPRLVRVPRPTRAHAVSPREGPDRRRLGTGLRRDVSRRRRSLQPHDGGDLLQPDQITASCACANEDNRWESACALFRSTSSHCSRPGHAGDRRSTLRPPTTPMPPRQRRSDAHPAGPRQRRLVGPVRRRGPSLLDATEDRDARSLRCLLDTRDGSRVLEAALVDAPPRRSCGSRRSRGSSAHGRGAIARWSTPSTRRRPRWRAPETPMACTRRS